jgi:hypothetical protein
MNRLAIALAIVALPALASAQTEEEATAEGDVVFVDSSEVEIVVVEEEEPTGPTFVEHEDTPQPEAQPAPQAQQVPPPPQQGQAQVDLTVPNPQLQMRDDRALLRQELSNHSLGGPIAMLAVGIPLAAIFTYGAYLAYHTEDIVDCFADDCASPNRTATAVLGTIAGVGLVLGTVGLITLIVRVGKRARIRQQFNRGELGAMELGTIRF